MAKLPRPGGKEMLRFLEKRGFQVIRIRGSHHFLEGHGMRTSIPVHGNRPLKIGTLRSILRDLQISVDDFTGEWGG